MNNVWFWVCVVLVIGLVFEVVDEVKRYRRRENRRYNWGLYYSYGRSMLSFYRSGNYKLEGDYRGYRKEVLKKICKDWDNWKVEDGERKSSEYVRYI